VRDSYGVLLEAHRKRDVWPDEALMTSTLPVVTASRDTKPPQGLTDQRSGANCPLVAT
jgi:hypothetical protein